MRKGYKAIQQAMRQNEVELLAHLRKYRVTGTELFSIPWFNALDRLMDGGMVRVIKPKGALVGRYTVVKGGRPVTPAVR